MEGEPQDFISELSDSFYTDANGEPVELTPIREQPELAEAQQIVIEGFWKAVEQRRE